MGKKGGKHKAGNAKKKNGDGHRRKHNDQVKPRKVRVQSCTQCKMLF